MKSVLLINFRRIGDILSALPIASDYKNGGYNVDLLIFEECAAIGPLLGIFSNIYTINRNLLDVTMKSELFNKSLAIDHLFEVAEKLKNNQYEVVVNSSTDTLGSYISGYLKAFNSTISGSYFDQNSILRYSDINTALLGEVNTVSDNHVNQLVFWNLKQSSLSSEIITENSYSNDICQLFSDLKSKFGPTNSALKIIGIQIFASSAEKSIPENIIESLIEDMFDQSSLYPILIVSHDQREIEVAQKLNKRFNEQLIIIQCDLKALAAVVKNVDLILSPDTMIVHLADNISTPVVEIVNTSLNWMKQATRRNTNLVIGHRHLNNARNSFSRAILFGIGTFFNIPAICDHVFSNEESLFKVATLNHQPVYIDCINEKDLSFIKQAYSVFLIGENQRSLVNLLSRSNIDHEMLTPIISSERAHLSELTKKIIAVMRIIKARPQTADSKMTETLSDIQLISRNLFFSSCIPIFLLNMLDRHAVEGEKLEHIIATMGNIRQLIRRTYQFLAIAELSKKTSIEQNYKKSKLQKSDVLLNNLSAL
jgi:ADP-heptose:LPS heptosyltransferase